MKNHLPAELERSPSGAAARQTTGLCALCHQTAELQVSHLIPMWAYRRVRAIDPSDPKALVHVSGGTAVLSNKQTKRRLLCAACEQRFSTNEDYLARLTAPDAGQIKLFRHITRLDTRERRLAALNRSKDGDEIAYFAASILWRGCVMTGECKLGPYEEKFRRYLLGTMPFPREAALSGALFEDSPDIDARGWVTEPASAKTPWGWLHGFLIAGLALRCWIGKSIPPGWHTVSLGAANAQKYISVLKPEDCADFLAAAELAVASKARGKLAMQPD